MPQNYIVVTKLGINHKTKILNCDPKAALLTPCLTNAFKNETNLVVKSIKLLKAKESRSSLLKATGCLMPCDTYGYTSQVLGSLDRQNGMDPANKIFNDKYKNSNGSIFILSHTKPDKVLFNQEVYRYDGMMFISDSGGVIGLFLGYSFWSIYELIVEPLYFYLVKRAKKKTTKC